MTMTKKKWLTAGLAVSMLATALVGCSSDSNTGDTAPADNKDGKIDATQEISLNLGDDIPSLDVSKATDSISFTVLGNAMEGLVHIDKDDNKVLPGMATDWKISDDGLKYTFNIRKDAKWSNGDPVTAHDFEYSWKRTLDPNTKGQYAFMLTWIKGGAAFNHGEGTADQVAVKAKDDYTLEVEIDTPRPYFLKQMAFPIFFPQNKKFVEAQGEAYGGEAKHFLSNGPFKLTDWTHEQQAILEKNENYWDKANVKLNKINFVMVKDSNARLNLYESGQLDTTALVREQIELYKDSKEKQTESVLSSWYVQFNQRVKELTNANVRKALTYAINAQSFVDVTLGNGSVPSTGLVPWGLADGNNGEWVKTQGDVLKRKDNEPKAKEFLEKGLKEVGSTAFPKIKLLTSDSTTAKKQAEFIQEQWRKNLGIEVDLEPVPAKLRFQRSAKKDFDVVISGWLPDYNDPMTYLDMWITDGDFNETGWSNAKYDELIKGANKESDMKKRTQMLLDAEKLLMEELPIGPLNFDATVRLQKPYVKDLIRPKMGPDFDLKYAYIQGKE